ncbi:MAG TPA: MaoC family dehydratase [Egibacteraceae bacterium]|nr:MaoC family dehydratase [Actinomycetota bacterium]HWB72801.1 MaoC family dehydratase [Egibacteraceae bacterium]
MSQPEGGGEGAERPLVLTVVELPAQVGRHLGYSGWHEVTQEQVDQFAEATGDHQWIHVDPERAASGPFGRTIAHGYLTLSLVPALLDEVLRIKDARLIVNYGLNRVRFPAPVPVGERVRLAVECTSASVFESGVQVMLLMTFEVTGQTKPACIADAVFRFYA